MSSTRLSLLLAVPLAAAGAALVAPGSSGGGAVLLADDPVRFHDADGDLLPDRLEWVLMLDEALADSDGDGTDDFLHAVQSRLSFSEPRTTFGYDDEARVVLSTEPNRDGSTSVWVHMLFRFAGSNVNDLRGLQPYIDIWGQRIPIERMIGSGGIHVALRQHATEGLYVLCAFELGRESMIRALLPCTIGATAIMGQRTIHTGMFATDAAGTTTAWVPVTRDSGVLQTLRPDTEENPFWMSSRVCLLRLAVVTTAPAGTICEVSAANCISSGKLSCPPTCLASRGQMVFFPDGLSTVTGGGN